MKKQTKRLTKNLIEIRIRGVYYLIDEEKKEATLTRVDVRRMWDKQGIFAVPNEVEGCKVTEIGSSSFAGCLKVVSVVFCENIKEIPRLAFNGCENLQRVTFITDTLTEIPKIGKEAFLNCENLKWIQWDGQVDRHFASFCRERKGISRQSRRHDEELLAEIMRKSEPGAFSGCWKMPVTLEEH